MNIDVCEYKAVPSYTHAVVYHIFVCVCCFCLFWLLFFWGVWQLESFVTDIKAAVPHDVQLLVVGTYCHASSPTPFIFVPHDVRVMLYVLPPRAS